MVLMHNILSVDVIKELNAMELLKLHAGMSDRHVHGCIGTWEFGFVFIYGWTDDFLSVISSMIRALSQ